MTKTQYLRALRQLKLTPASHATAAALGLSRRQCQRIAAGECRVPPPVERLLTMMIEVAEQTGCDLYSPM